MEESGSSNVELPWSLLTFPPVTSSPSGFCWQDSLCSSKEIGVGQRIHDRGVFGERALFSSPLVEINLTPFLNPFSPSELGSRRASWKRCRLCSGQLALLRCALCSPGNGCKLCCRRKTSKHCSSLASLVGRWAERPLGLERLSEVWKAALVPL